MKKEIMLQNTAKGLVAHNLINGKPNPEIVALFGTHILPCANMPGTMEEAVERIEQLNPGVRVSSI